MDWQEIKRELEKVWWESKQRFESECQPGGALHRARNDPAQLFVDLCRAYARGDRAGLIEYLRSYHLSEDCPSVPPGLVCLVLADMLEGEFDPPEKRGRPRNQRLHTAAYTAGNFYHNWRELCLAAGVDHYGKANAMKTEAIHFAVEYEELKLTEDELDKVRELMDAPKSRRGKDLPSKWPPFVIT